MSTEQFHFSKKGFVLGALAAIAVVTLAALITIWLC
jgi:hypothetical protein